MNGFAIVLLIVYPFIFLQHVGRVDQQNGMVVLKQVTLVDHEITQLQHGGKKRWKLLKS